MASASAPSVRKQAHLPALSFTRQPDLKRLFEHVLDPSQKVTIFCGAGVSVDSGLPNWRNLIRNLADRITQPEVRKALLDDESDLTRKVGLIMQLVKGSLPESSVISEALYKGGIGGLDSGQLATAIATLAVAIKDRARIVTTNYDDRLEEALQANPASPPVEPVGLTEASGWVTNLSSASRFEVLHLHGYLSSDGKKQIEKIVLSEADYLSSGNEVQGHIEAMLKNSLVLFVGVSMTDPAVVGPLYKLKAAGIPTLAYAIMSRDYGSADAGDSEGRLGHSYLAMVADYLDHSLGVTPILLKSFAQVAQCVLELAVAVENQTDYMSDDPSISIRYGHRFNRILTVVHDKLRIEAGGRAPGSPFADQLSQALHDHLSASSDSPLAFITKAKTDYLNLDDLGVDRQRIDSEFFGLYLWLRCMNDAALPPFKIFMAGTSAYTHRNGASINQSSPVWPGSSFISAKCVFYGRSRTEALALPVEKSRPYSTWRSFLAAPLMFSEQDAGISATNDHLVTIGATVLHSSRRMVPAHEIAAARSSGHDVEKALQPSLLSLMDASQKEELLTLCSVATKNAILSLL